jgi:hypothetical protein
MKKGISWMWIIGITLVIAIIGGSILWNFSGKNELGLIKEITLEKANISEIRDLLSKPEPPYLYVKFDNTEFYKSGENMRLSKAYENEYFLNGTYIVCKLKNETWTCESRGRYLLGRDWMDESQRPVIIKGLTNGIIYILEELKNPDLVKFSLQNFLKEENETVVRGAKDVKILGRLARCFYLDACKLWEKKYPLVPNTFKCKYSEVVFCFDKEYGILLEAREYIKGERAIIDLYENGSWKILYWEPYERNYTQIVPSISFDPLPPEALQLIGKIEKVKITTRSSCFGGYFVELPCVHLGVGNLGSEPVKVSDLKINLIEIPGKVKEVKWVGEIKEILPGMEGRLDIYFYHPERNETTYKYKIEIIDPIGGRHYEEGNCTLKR